MRGADQVFHPLRDQRLIGVAGSVAEWCWNNWDDPDFGDDIYESMSDTDRAIGCGKRRRWLDLDHSTLREETAWRNAVDRAHKLFNRANGKLWHDLLREARNLIVASRGIRLERAA